MKKLLMVLSALFLIPSLAHARGRSASGFSGNRGGSAFSAGRSSSGPHYNPSSSAGHLRGFSNASSPRSLGARSRLTGGSSGQAPAPAPITPGIPAVEGAFIRDNAMFVKQEATGEGQRWYGPSAGGILVASDDGRSQSLGGAGMFVGRPDNQTSGGSSTSGGFGTFFANSGAGH